MTGKFITFEGMDGAGKTTQARSLANWLRSEYQLEVLETREPGGTAFGERLRELFLAVRDQDISPVTEVLLMFAMRNEHLSQHIIPALNRGAWVICDRFTDSTYAYQGGGRQVKSKLIDDLARFVHPQNWPDLTFYIRSPPARSSAPLIANESFEDEDVEFFNRVYQGYESLVKQHQRIVIVRDCIGNKRRAVEDIERQIKKVVKEKLIRSTSLV